MTELADQDGFQAAGVIALLGCGHLIEDVSLF